ncbi:MAG: NAD(P)-dependent oxidoreductase [Chloroflexi bacterium]|nr:NAD(P)-dependent oxidoreductase [Chloroflexota bacterium]
MTDRSDLHINRKARLKIPRQPIGKQAPESRIGNWDEVYQPISLEIAKAEAMRCIQCPAAPCIKACPADNDIPGALWKLEHGDAFGAAETFYETNNLPEMCGRLCPQESLCEGSCVVGKNAQPVAIGRLEAFAADHYRENGGYEVDSLPPATGQRIAVIGAGPAGLAVAEELAKKGHSITIFDSWSEAGGVLLYGIPNFKMQKEILDAKLDYLWQLGITFIGDTYIGRDLTIDQLFEQGYHAVFLGFGASQGNDLELPGGDLPGVIQATEYLVRGNLKLEQLPEAMREPLPQSERVLVIGGGDTSMDCVRTALRLGANEVTCAYRRTEAEQRGRVEERVHALEEGIRFEYLAAPLRFEAGADGRVARMQFGRMELGEPDESGRRRPVPTGEEFTVAADTVVIAIGYHIDEELTEAASVVSQHGTVVIDRETGRTSRPGVFAGGDCVNGADLVVTALADGRRAAKAIDCYLICEREAVA